MSYANGFVVAVKDSNGKVLRETNRAVYLPFYEEYSLLLKNNNDRKAVAKIFIDGEEISKGKIIIDANSEVTIERFIEDLEEGRRFQFVPASDNRIAGKDMTDLGIVEVKFTLEEKQWETPAYWIKYDMFNPKAKACGQSMARGASVTSMSYTCSSASTVGGTAAGSRSEQKFVHGSTGWLESSSTTIKIRLLPSEEKKLVENTRDKYCDMCGSKNRYEANYCHNCGNKF